jgi:hypothetical protein
LQSISVDASCLRCCVLFARFFACAQAKTQAPSGLWDGTIQGKAGEVNFGVDVQVKADGTMQATLVNATDRQPFSSAAWKDGVLTLGMDYYDGVLTAHMVSPQRMEGEYSRRTSKGMAHIPVVLVPHQDVVPGKPWTGSSLWGDWLFHWADGEGCGEDHAGQVRSGKDCGGQRPRRGDRRD